MKKLIQTLLLVTLLLGGSAWAGKVDINKADAAALQENLQGVGPVKAKAIIDYRKKNGSFKTYDDLMKVPGIGEETVKKNKANLSLKGGITKASSTAKKASEKASSAKTKASSEKKSAESKAKAKAEKSKKDVKKSAKDSAKKTDSAKNDAKKKVAEKAKSASK